MTTPTDRNRELLTIVASMRAMPGRERELRAALEALVEPTSREEGFVNYDVHQGVDDPALFCLYENWTSAERLAAHLASPHITEFSARLDGLLDGRVTILRLRRIA